MTNMCAVVNCQWIEKWVNDAFISNKYMYVSEKMTQKKDIVATPIIEHFTHSHAPIMIV